MRKAKPHRYQQSPYGGCRKCGSALNARIHQSLLWRVLHRKQWA